MVSQNNIFSINLGYAQFQLAKVLLSHDNAGDNTAKQNAQRRIKKWQQVLQHMIDGQTQYGSRTPLQGVPAWVTLEVATGGFATGAYLAGGAMQEHEKALLVKLIATPDKNQERLALNTYFLTEEGLNQLYQWLENGAYDITVPEEGALLTVAYLLRDNKSDEARELIEKISPWFAHLRFYPVPLAQPQLGSTGIRVQNIEDSVRDLQNIRENLRILAQKEAVEIWSPFKDKMVALFLQTFKDEVPCQKITVVWKEEAIVLLNEFKVLRKQYTLCGKVDKKKTHFYQLKAFLQRSMSEENTFSEAELKQIALIVKQHIHKYGQPYTVQHQEYRQKQQFAVAAPCFYQISKALVYRFEGFPKGQGVDELDVIISPITLEEEKLSHVPQGTQIPQSLQHKLLRSFNTSLEELINLGLVTSGEVIAQLLPQLTSQIKAIGIENALLRTLYAKIYRAFRRRRSLLLLNLEKQVRLEELPWVKAIEKYSQTPLSNKILAKETLAETCILTLRAFPQAILPNKLLQELNALAKTAKLDLPLTEELAADIFMGTFSPKFVEAIKLASKTMRQTLYANYYGIDYEEILSTLEPEESEESNFFTKLIRKNKPIKNNLLGICEKRSGVKYGGYNVAEHGMLLEQAQILSTHNLAILFNALNLQATLKGNLPDMAKTCFIFICKRLQMPFMSHHAALIGIKQSAYAWRQMVFYLSFLREGEQKEFFAWINKHLLAQKATLQLYFNSVVFGLIGAVNGKTPAAEAINIETPRMFLAWSSNHWLLSMLSYK